MYWALIKTQLLLHMSLFLPRKKNKNVGITKTVGLFSTFIYIGILISIGVGFLLNYLAKIILTTKIAWIYFVLVGLMYIFIGFFGSITSAKNFMFDSKDNELLLSMPITSRALLICRISVLLIMNTIYSLLVSVPCLIVYAGYTKITLGFLLIYFLSWLLIVLMSVTLTCLFGLIIGFIMSKVRRKYLAGTIATGMIFVLIYFLVKYVQKFGGNILSKVTGVGDIVKKVIPPIYYFGQVCYNRSVSSLFRLMLWSLIPFLAVFLVLSAMYFKILTTNKGVKKSAYKGRYAFYGTPRLALIKKELKRIFTVTVYLMNCTVGMLMHLVVIIALIINSSAVMKFLLSIQFIKNFFPIIIVFYLCLSTTSACTTSCSVSIEGDHFWIIKSMPAGAGSVIFAKIAANLVITLPTMLVVQTMICQNYSFKRNEIIYIYAIPILSQICIAMIGIFMNLLLPKLIWNNPTMPVKQSASVSLTMLLSFAINVLPIVVYFFVLKEKLNAGLLLAFTLVYFLVAFFFLLCLLLAIGRRRYNNLSC